uniref:Uncharacterized protein n=1 Tax=Myoviridae sp. ctijX18 TaxID=2825154 RepID=A0A8S5USS4_9CAUD|nr:MAG TPA: hypothetical protein [Myoviridae sp. ctijX18]DAQ61214.1 MAG TPA: hypothetical protein [Caudoviricetes sp.]DAR92354.1 MAG TPA: hypothetical protein [Caudoviricetes sp.]DAX86787.1 MAG TPA: hypothetical protein [Caudoviricetes sp.]
MVLFIVEIDSHFSFSFKIEGLFTINVNCNR